MTVDQRRSRTVKFLKWFPRLNHFYVQINKGHLWKDGGYSSQNIVFQLTTIKTRTTAPKVTNKIIHIKPHLKNSDKNILLLKNDQPALQCLYIYRERERDRQTDKDKVNSIIKKKIWITKAIKQNTNQKWHFLVLENTPSPTAGA